MSDIKKIPLSVVITSTNRIKALELSIINLQKTRIYLNKKGLDIRYSILSTNSNSEKYRRKCRNTIKKYHNSIDYYFEINDSDSFDLHYKNLIFKIKEIEKNQENKNFFYFLGDDDLINPVPFLNICYSIINKPQNVYLNKKNKYTLFKFENRYKKFNSVIDTYKYLWSKIKYGSVIYQPSFDNLEIINKNLYITNQHLFSIHFWFSLSNLKYQIITTDISSNQFAISLKIKKYYNNSALKLYLRDIPLSILLTSKLLNIKDREVINKYFFFRVGFISKVALLRSFYIIKSIIKGEKFSKSTFSKFIFLYQIYLLVYKMTQFVYKINLKNNNYILKNFESKL